MPNAAAPAAPAGWEAVAARASSCGLSLVDLLDAPAELRESAALLLQATWPGERQNEVRALRLSRAQAAPRLARGGLPRHYALVKEGGGELLSHVRLEVRTRRGGGRLGGACADARGGPRRALQAPLCQCSIYSRPGPDDEPLSVAGEEVRLESVVVPAARRGEGLGRAAVALAARCAAALGAASVALWCHPDLRGLYAGLGWRLQGRDAEESQRRGRSLLERTLGTAMARDMHMRLALTQPEGGDGGGGQRAGE